MKILIAVATYNRTNVTRNCLQNLQVIRNPNCKLVIYDDCSTSYDKGYLEQYADEVVRFERNGGIERSRAKSFRDFVYRFTDYDLLYLTDNDTLHDPKFLEILSEIYKTQQAEFDNILPMGLFNSVFHSYHDNIITETKEFYISRTCPGVSQCYDRKMASKIVDALNTSPTLETTYGWDYLWPATLGLPFLVTKTSYVEHFARDLAESGMHSQNSGASKENFLKDFERDKALNPTPYLEMLRDDAINAILNSR